MKTNHQSVIEQIPPNPIRVETALSRYPVHRLAKQGDLCIDIREKNESGEISIKWEVSHSPGPLAYKLDTLIVNRRIEEAGKPIPRIIRLGSLRDLCRELGLSEGRGTLNVKNSMYQNASAFIKCKIRYKKIDGGEKSLEAGFTRYSVVLTGEELPNGRKADAVYIVLNDIYMQVINGAMTRPLDYDYLKSLPPAAQRFYELLSYQMYAAIKNDRPRAKLVYSELCRYAPLTRQAAWNQVRPQLARIHAPHKKSGYIARIDFNEIADADGNLDWEICYQPGPKARAEFRAFTKRGGPVMLEVEPFTADSLPLLSVPEPSALESSLIGHGITASVAAELVREHGEDKVSLQVEHLEWLNEKYPGKVSEPGAWLRSAIINGITPPKRFVPKVERLRQAEKKQQAQEQEAQARRQQREQEAAEKAKDKRDTAYWESLAPEQQDKLQAEADAQADPAQLAMQTGPFKSMGQTLRRREYIRRLLDGQESKLSQG